MARVSNKWDNEESWNYHITSKNIMREVINSDNDEDLNRLNEIQFDEKLLENTGEGDPPNMDFMRKLWAETLAYAQKIGMPLFVRPWFEKGGKWVISLYRQDSAYAERIGGIIQYIQYNEKAWKRCKNKKQRVAFIKDTRDWWNDNDTRDRTRGWIMKMWNRAIAWYDTKEFWEKLINFVINWCIDHNNEWQAHVMYDPKVWFPRGRGGINVLLHGGIA